MTAEEILGEKKTVVPDYTEHKEFKKVKFRNLAAQSIELKQQITEATLAYNKTRAEMEHFFLARGQGGRARCLGPVGLLRRA